MRYIQLVEFDTNHPVREVQQGPVEGLEPAETPGRWLADRGSDGS